MGTEERSMKVFNAIEVDLIFDNYHFRHILNYYLGNNSGKIAIKFERQFETIIQ